MTLTDPSDQQVMTLRAFPFSRHETVLHTDSALLPKAREAGASWNYRMSSSTTTLTRNHSPASQPRQPTQLAGGDGHLGPPSGPARQSAVFPARMALLMTAARPVSVRLWSALWIRAPQGGSR